MHASWVAGMQTLASPCAYPSSAQPTAGAELVLSGANMPGDWLARLNVRGAWLGELRGVKSGAHGARVQRAALCLEALGGAM